MAKYIRLFIIIVILNNIVWGFILFKLPRGQGDVHSRTLRKINDLEALNDTLLKENLALEDTAQKYKLALINTEKGIQEIDKKLIQNEKYIIKDTTSVQFYTDDDVRMFFAKYPKTRSQADSLRNK